MVQNKYTFDPVAYLRDNPDAANPAIWQSDPYSHYLEAKAHGDIRNATFRDPTASDFSNWQAKSYLINPNDAESSVQYFQDPNTGNVYNVFTNDEGYDYKNAKLLATGEAQEDPYLKYLNIGDPSKLQEFYNLKSSNPNQFYSQAATELAKTLGGISHQNGVGVSFETQQEMKNQLESIKDINPKAYYQGKLSLLSDLTGWDYGQNTPERSAARLEEIKSLIPQARKAGLSAEEINNLTTNTINQSARANQERIANEKASGNFYTQSLLGALKVGGLALGAYGLDTALAAAAEGGLGGLTATELAGPTYGELGYTGLAEGAAGPTYAELGYTGLNNQEAIALADAAAKSGLSIQDAYKAYSRTKQLANLLQSATGGQSGKSINPQALATALQAPQEQFGGLYRMNQNPFAQTQQPTTVQNPFGKTQDFLAQLSEESKPEPTLADLLRNA